MILFCQIVSLYFMAVSTLIKSFWFSFQEKFSETGTYLWLLENLLWQNELGKELWHRTKTLFYTPVNMKQNKKTNKYFIAMKWHHPLLTDCFDSKGLLALWKCYCWSLYYDNKGLNRGAEHSKLLFYFIFSLLHTYLIFIIKCIKWTSELWIYSFINPWWGYNPGSTHGLPGRTCPQLYIITELTKWV